MEIFKVGDEVSIIGYKSIKLSEDMQKNVSEFAELNNVELSEAERILTTVPGIKEFASTVYTDDLDEDIELLNADFELEDNEFDVSKMKLVQNSLATQKVGSTNDVSFNSIPQRTSALKFADDVIPAKPSSNNPEDLKDLLGIFGLDASTVIPDADLIKEGTKITGFKLNGKTYEVIVDSKGIITQTRITDEKGNVKRGTFPYDEKVELKWQLEDKEEELYKAIAPFIRSSSKSFGEYYQEKLKQAIIDCVNIYSDTIDADNMFLYIKRYLSDVEGFDVKDLSKEYHNYTFKFLDIRDICKNVCDINAKIREVKAEEAKYTTDTISVGGLNFKTKFLTGRGSCSITEDNDGNIVITGNNCTVDILGYGKGSQNIVINGSGITFNANASTVEEIKNNSQNSVINGSFGNDNIFNNTGADNCVINAGDSDDNILNYANNTQIKGDNGNDTIVNYGQNATIDGGKGDDAINYVDGSANILTSEGKDLLNIIKRRGTPIPNPPDEYNYYMDFEIGGIKFRAYSKIDNFESLKTDFYKNLLTINVADMKIEVSDATDKSSIKLEGSNIKFYTSKTLKAVFNHAEKSVINGSDGDDYLYNYTDNSTVNGGAGADTIIVDAKNTTVDGGAGADNIYIRDKGDKNTHVINQEASDKILDGDPSNIELDQPHPEVTKENNFQANFSYISAALENKSEPSISGISEETVAAARNLVSKLVTTNNGKKELSELAKKIIAKEKSITSSTLADLELLKLALRKLDTTNDGNISDAELDKFQELPTTDVTNPTADLETIGNEIKSLVGLTSTELTSFINSCGSTDAALKMLKQIKAMISVGVQMDTRTKPSDTFISTIKDIMTSSVSNFNNEILDDAQILVDAENAPEGKNAYIKSQMIKDGSNLSLTELASKTSVGEVAEKDGKLYVNDSGKMVELKMSADKYLELFPPVGRFFIQQNWYEDCFFISTALIESMENQTSKAKMLQMFSENKTTGDVTITFPGVSDYPVTFFGGNLKNIDGKYSGKNVIINKATDTCKGYAMLEQAYALAKFADLSNQNITYNEIKTDYSQELADALKASGKVTNASNIDMDMALQYYVGGNFPDPVLKDLFGGKDAQAVETYGELMQAVADPNVLTTAQIGDIKISDEDAQKYGLVKSHQYTIESMSATSVTIKNPFESYKTITIPKSVFFAYFTYMSKKTIV